jgi:hypothetical protein
MKIAKISRPTTPPEITYRGIRYVLTNYDLSTKIDFYEFEKTNFLLVKTIPYKSIKLSKRLDFVSRTVIYRESIIENF